MVLDLFWPDDTADCFYVTDDISFSALVERINKKWPGGVSLNQVHITAHHIHTFCLGYDQYDSTDYTDFIRVEYVSG